MSIDEVLKIAATFGPDSLRAAIEQHVAEAVKRERDECARVCDDIRAYRPTTGAGGLIAEECAAAIRARAEKETK